MAGRAAQLERHAPGAVLSNDAVDGLGRYLSGPLRTQLESEHPGGSATKVSFVFGHTHKPFARREVHDGFAQPVEGAKVRLRAETFADHYSQARLFFAP